MRFVIDRDPRARFRFAALQSDAARRACAAAGHAAPLASDPDSVIVITAGRVLERSDAALAVAAALPFPWPLLGAFRVLPRPARDAVYRIVARNRYRWFGKRESCMVPTPELRARFVE